MKHTITAVSLLLLFAAVTVAQSSAPKPAPELKKWDIWIGDWAFSGRAKDSPTGPEYNLDWHMHGHWVLGGFFRQLETTWKGNGEEGQTLAILSYDPIKKIHIVSGFGSDGATWTNTFTFDKETVTVDNRQLHVLSWSTSDMGILQKLLRSVPVSVASVRVWAWSP